MIKLKLKPSEVKREVLEGIANRTDQGLQDAILISLSDGKSRTEKKIGDMVNTIAMVSAIELNIRDGMMTATKNFDWFTNWKVKMLRMKCPNCSFIWKHHKEIKNCQNCGFDLILYSKKMFPKLEQKLSKKKADKK